MSETATDGGVAETTGTRATSVACPSGKVAALD